MDSIIQEIDPDLVNSSPEEEGQGSCLWPLEDGQLDIEFVVDSISKQHGSDNPISAGLHRPLKRNDKFLGNRKKKLTEGERNVSLDKSKPLARSLKRSVKDTAEKLLLKATEGLKENPKLVRDAEAIFILQFADISYTIDLTSATPTCDCPRYKMSNRTCKHVVMTNILLGVKNNEKEKKILTSNKLYQQQRTLLDNKIVAFDGKDQTIKKNLENFRKTLEPQTSNVMKNLPVVESCNYQQFNSYNEAMQFIKNEDDTNVEVKWYATQAHDNRRLCPAIHEGEQRISKGCIVMAVDYNTVRKRMDGQYTLNRGRRHFHAREECLISIPNEMQKFTNIKNAMSCSVDVSTLQPESREQLKLALPNLKIK